MRKKYANVPIFNFCLRINDTNVRFCQKIGLNLYC